jgi:hypothetical protein
MSHTSWFLVGSYNSSVVGNVLELEIIGTLLKALLGIFEIYLAII